MWKCDAGTAFDLLPPRFNVDKQGRASRGWPVDGNRMKFNLQVTPRSVDLAVRRAMDDWDKSGHDSVVRRFNIAKAYREGRVWAMQTACKSRTVAYMLKNRKWNRWKKSALPIYLVYRGKVTIWNGTHRTVVSILADKSIRTRVIDLDKFVEWRKAHPDRTMWNISRVIKIKPRKKAKRRGR